MFEEFRSHTNFFIREVGDLTSPIGEIRLLQNSSEMASPKNAVLQEMKDEYLDVIVRFSKPQNIVL